MSSSHSIIEFSKSTEYSCLYVGASVILIMAFILYPLNSIIGNLLILGFLGYTMYYNLRHTNKFAKELDINIFNISIWDPLKTNVLCNYLFSLSLLVLMASIMRKILFKRHTIL
jgi:hypothetical protein